MYMEPDIEALYRWAEPFEHSYFSFLDEYEDLWDQYLALYCALEESIDFDSLDTLNQLLNLREQLENFHTRHAFREGVRLARENGLYHSR